jgi:hypothetical protein
MHLLNKACCIKAYARDIMITHFSVMLAFHSVLQQDIQRMYTLLAASLFGSFEPSPTSALPPSLLNKAASSSAVGGGAGGSGSSACSTASPPDSMMYWVMLLL